MQCQSKDALGKPGVGFHKHVAGVALGDVIGTVMMAAIIANFDDDKNDDKNNYQASTVTWFLRLFILGQLMHWYFCVDTAFIKALLG